MTNDIANQSENTATRSISPVEYTASIYSSERMLPAEFVKGVKEIEAELDMPVWLFVQNGAHQFGGINSNVYKSYFDQRNLLPKGRQIALLIDSPGGDPASAYKLARLLIKQCGGFVALIPNYAKSAATLLALGASKIILGNYAELGPLDMQVADNEGENTQSALNHVQTLERLGAYSKRTLDETVLMLLMRTQKKINSILPFAIDFTTSLVKPLMENIDVVKYTEMSRLLKIGEEYAVRLLKPKYGEGKSEEIAQALVSKYPEHGFVIDSIEAKDIGLITEPPEGKIAEAYTKILPFLDNITALGILKEADNS